jgi:hypothetical protein
MPLVWGRRWGRLPNTTARDQIDGAAANGNRPLPSPALRRPNADGQSTSLQEALELVALESEADHAASGVDSVDRGGRDDEPASAEHP